MAAGGFLLYPVKNAQINVQGKKVVWCNKHDGNEASADFSADASKYQDTSLVCVPVPRILRLQDHINLREVI